MAAPAYKNGKNGRLSYGGAFLKIIEWDGEHKIETVEVTNTESGGAQEMDPIGGVESFNGSFTAIVLKGTPSPQPGGTDYFDLILYEGDHATTEAYAFKCTLSSVKHTNKVKSTDPITVVCQYHSSGAIGKNTATVPTPPGP